MNGFSETVDVVGLITDIDQYDEYRVRVQFGMKSSPPPQTMPSPFPPQSRLGLVLELSLPVSEWKDQYKIQQRYELAVKETGELTLIPEKT